MYETCSGTFHDSGGPAGDYADGEDLTVTLCPVGGAGSGPLTIITFTAWAVAAGDVLTIHDGPDATGPVLAVGDNANSLLSLSFTASAPHGCLTFRWLSDAAGVAAGWSATITTGPDAGEDASTTACSNEAPFNMRQRLGGSPDTGGAWTGPGGPHGDTFDPATDPPGDYVYTVTNPAPCPPATATLSITVVPAANAGSNGLLALCSDDDPVLLSSGLGSPPQGGGSWSGPGGPHGDTFDPADDPQGTYTYTVTGVPPCLDASASVLITVNPRPDAGLPGDTTVCSNGSPFPLFPLLGGTPDGGGNWTRPNGTPHSGVFTPGTSMVGTYTYTVPGLPPCQASVSTVEVTQIDAPDPGEDRSITLCSDEPPFVMTTQLGGTPDLGGSWTGPNGPHGGTFDPATDDGGTYTYSVVGTFPCADASATLTITVRRKPVAGTDGTLDVCSTEGVLQLVSVLGGDPDPGGAWTFGVDPAGPTFTPGVSPEGVYTYTVTGQAPCTPSSATATITVVQAPFAGVGTGITLCGNDPAQDLAPLLGPGIDAGSWSGPSGAHSGTFNPASDPPGPYIYTVTGTPPCANASAVVNVAVTAPPNAGSDTSVTVCGNDAAFALLPLLGTGAQGGGTWTGPGGPHSGTFDPGADVQGPYVYTVPGSAPCADASATVVITVVAPPDPGTSSTIAVCSSDLPLELITQLAGTPDGGGSWTRPSGTAHSGTYLPASEPGGTYTYTVAGSVPCANASASVVIDRTLAPNAGTDGSTTVCSTNAPFDLFPLLGGSPPGTGTWVDANGDPASATFTPGSTVAGVFRYVVAGDPPCANDTAQVTVNVNTAPDAGGNGSITVCSNDAPFDLDTVLTGQPDGGGTWIGPGGPMDGTFVPGTSPAGGYTYSVAGLAPCPNASAVASVAVNPQPNAGTGGSFARCTTDPAVDLFTLLTDSPQQGGTWAGPGGPLPGGLFLPATSPDGDYIYTVTGLAPCADATAVLTATVDEAPDAGTSGSLTVCTGTVEVDLFTGLGGSPDGNGTWNDDDNTGQLSGPFFITMGMPPGTYAFTYTVPAIGPCDADSATVTVTIVPGLDAGSDGNLTVCGSNALVNLFNGLGGNPQPGGQWIDLQGTGALVSNIFNATLVQAGTYTFRYRLLGSGACDPDSAQTTVTVVAPPNPGCNTTVTLCSDDAPTFLFDQLPCSPQVEGQWRRDSPTGAIFSGIYNPLVDSPGEFYHVIASGAPCGTVFARVIVQETQQLDPGLPADVTACDNGDPFTMFPFLGGTPAPGGTWSFNNQSHGPTFVPGLDAAGPYTYTVQGPAPCLPRSANLTVIVAPSAFAGVSSSKAVCSNDAVFVLIAQLGPGVQTGGTWLLPSGGTSPNPFLTYTPGTSEPGDYFYVVQGTSPCANDTALVSVFETPAPWAGTSGSAQLCSNSPQLNLFTVLGNNPDAGGAWTGPAPGNPPFSGLFFPGSSPAGVYTYTVAPTVPCTTAVTSTVTIGVNPLPSPGVNTSIQRCTTNSAFGLTGMLQGNPTPDGVWTGPAPSTDPLAVPFFDPGANPPGTYVYTYTTPLLPGCAQSSATLTVVLNGPPNAGNDADLAICTTSGQVNLFGLLGSNAQPGGTWTAQSTGLPFSGDFIPSVDQTDIYIYTVQGQAPCLSDQALVNVVNNTPPNAGVGGTFTYCSNDPFVNLFGLLSNDPQASIGSGWSPTTVIPGFFTPGSDPAGVYTYTVPGSAGCANATAQVVINVNNAVEAGVSATVETCANGPQINLLSALGTTAQSGGIWTNPVGTTVTATYTPGLSLPGTYTYRLQADAPCTNDSATVTVVQFDEPNAGCSGTHQVCTSQPTFNLLDVVGCGPGTGGAWTFNNQPHGGQFDPATDPSGIYVYTVPGDGPCAPAVVTLQVQVIPAPYPGNSTSLAACVGDVLDLLVALGPGAEGGGSWAVSPPIVSVSGNTFNTVGAPPGTYVFTYTLAATGPCPSSSRTVTVSLSQQIDAGEDANIGACTSETSVDLFSALGPDAQLGGFWIDVDGSNALQGEVFNPSAAGPGEWRFDHIVAASPQSACVNDTARVAVTVVLGPFAGNSSSANLCNSSPPVAMFTYLQGFPDPGGFWLAPDLSPTDGTFVVGSDPVGTYYYVRTDTTGVCPSDTNTLAVSLTPATYAGLNASLNICSSAAPLNMFTLLGAAAQTGGTWFRPDLFPHGGGGIYNPAVDGPGLYRYVVFGQGPCPNDTAFVTVSEQQAPFAGNDNSLVLCSNVASQNLAPLLGGGVTPGGVWTGPAGVLPGGLLDPAVHPTGPYVYFLSGAPICPDDSAVVLVSITAYNDAGSSNNNVPVCVALTTLDLFPLLGSNATPGGTWSIVTPGAPPLIGSVFNPSQAGAGSYTYQYSFTANPPCLGSSASITLNVVPGADPGVGGDIVVCGADDSFDLFSALGGSPTPGGSWTDIVGTGGLLPGGLLNATLLPPGTLGEFGYLVVDPSCGAVSSVLVVTISAYPDPGVGGTLTLCSTSGPVDLFTQLGGTPEAGGTWSGPSASPGTFVPGSDTPGAYSYTLNGNLACPDSAAVLIVEVNNPPDAGADGATLVCDTLTALSLFPLLDGTPQSGGTWTDPEGTGALIGDAVNTTLLGVGVHTYQYTVTVPACGSASSVVRVTVKDGVLASTPVAICNPGERTYTVSFTVSGGDPASYTVEGLSGAFTAAAPWTFTSTALFTSQPFSATVYDQYACARVTVEGASPCEFDSEVFVPQAFSPNGDGINDSFVIPGIEGYPANRITIFNRWGGRMFEGQGYDNRTVVWDGTSPDGLYAGTAPAGTYYYILELGEGTEPLTGYIYLNR